MNKPWVGLVGGLLLLMLVVTGGWFFSLNGAQSLVLGLAALMATWWVTECLPLYVTSLVPLVVFPLTGVRSASAVSGDYVDANVILLLGGFFLAVAIEKWDLHRRMALRIVDSFGQTPRRLVLGFMVATAFLSMWISNTASVVMMFAIGSALVVEFDREGTIPAYFTRVLLLSIAYSASIGGVATLIGTPPNLVLAAQYAKLNPTGTPLSFGYWMAFAVPLSGVFLTLAWLYLTRWHADLSTLPIESTADSVDQKLQDLGPLAGAEKRVAGVFLVTVLGWLFWQPLEIGGI